MGGGGAVLVCPPAQGEIVNDRGPGGLTGKTTVGLTRAAKRPGQLFLSTNSEDSG